MDANAFVHDRVHGVGRLLLPSVRQLISIDQHNEPEPVGSCVLIWHGSQRYLLSAAHVMDVFIKKPMFIGTASTWHQIVGDFRASTSPTGKSREEASYDYAM